MVLVGRMTVLIVGVNGLKVVFLVTINVHRRGKLLRGKTRKAGDNHCCSTNAAVLV